MSRPKKEVSLTEIQKTRISPWTKMRLAEAASRNNISVSDIVRKLIDDYLEQKADNNSDYDIFGDEIE